MSSRKLVFGMRVCRTCGKARDASKMWHFRRSAYCTKKCQLRYVKPAIIPMPRMESQTEITDLAERALAVRLTWAPRQPDNGSAKPQPQTMWEWYGHLIERRDSLRDMDLHSRVN